MVPIKFWNWDTNENAEVKLIPFILKILGCFLIVLTIYESVNMIIENAWDDAKYNSTEQRLQVCDRYFYNRDFAGLYDELTLYDLNSEEFDSYWEAVDGYWDYLQYTMWKEAFGQGQLAQEDEKLVYFKEAVCRNADECKFQTNQRLLNGYKELVLEE